ncbi:protein NO VEIN domain-containing protein [Nocardioides albus]|uniref:protein NO VEIN domain-containing protein n=1 Tax=Nocardioides albus TaxID=1841 RepID=UPI001615CF4D|nr:hypothetical protein GCM10007979_04390 [Nocardioides albus]
MPLSENRLTAAGREDLAVEVRHVSVGDGDGDGLGYDIQSFQGPAGEPVFIEVKTTAVRQGGALRHICNRGRGIHRPGPTYRLWRLYRYGKPDTGHYRLPGPLTQCACLRPDSYRRLPSVGS